MGEHREHGEYEEHGKDVKHQPDDLKHSMIQNTLFVTQKALFANKLTRNALFYGIKCDG